MIERFLELLNQATSRIPDDYFWLPVADTEEVFYRERVYCYELYHQLRMLLDDDEHLRSYSLAGEVDKKRHPIIRPYVPDFVLHRPGAMKNLVVMEVKPIDARVERLREDIKKLQYFVSQEGGYQCGIQLVYGATNTAIEQFREEITETNNDHLRLVWHRHPGKKAEMVPLAPPNV